MFRNLITTAVRDLIKHKTHTAINLIGLAVAVAVCLLIFLFVRDELSYDNFHAFKDSVYELVALEPQVDSSVRTDIPMPIPLGPVYRDAMPGVESMTRWLRAHVVVETGSQASADVVTYVDSTFFDILTFPLRYGDSATALNEQNEVVISRKKAIAYFGREDVVGKRLEYLVAGKHHSALVTGVADDIPHNSSIRFTILQRIEDYPAWDRYRDNWKSWRCFTYVKLKPNANPRDIEAAGSTFAYDNIPSERQRLAMQMDSTRFVLQPVYDIHLNLSGRWDIRTPGSITNSYILTGIALLVLIIACLNYIILALGVSTGRMREVGMRKVLGAVPAQLTRQFIIEALILASLAVSLGLALAELALPVFDDMTGKTFASNLQGGWPILVLLAGLAIMVGFAAGAAPAAVMSRTKPILALKGQVNAGPLAKVGWILVAVQFALTIFLIFGALTIARQMSYLNSADLGYDNNNLMVIPTHASALGEGQRVVDRLRDTLRSDPYILGVSGTSIAFSEGSDLNHWSRDREELWAYFYTIDPDYVRTMGIQLIAGRDFDPARTTDRDQAVILNETAAKQYGLDNQVGEVLPEFSFETGGPEVRVIGIVKDHNFLSLKNTVDPMLLLIHPGNWIEDVLVRVAPGQLATEMPRIASIWQSTFPNLPYNPELLEDMLASQYNQERRWQQVTLVASIIAIIIACMGLFGQVTLTIARRTKEIGIRKVMGASVTSVAVLLSGRLLIRIAIAGLLSSTAAYYVMSRWLEQFSYRVELGIESFAIAIGAALIIALTTAGVRTVRAATANPTESLRYE